LRLGDNLITATRWSLQAICRPDLLPCHAWQRQGNPHRHCTNDARSYTLPRSSNLLMDDGLDNKQEGL